MSDPADRSPARERRHDLGEVDGQERAQLAARFGSVLRLERGYLTQQQLADAAGFDRSTIVRLETGRRRPTTASIWKLAKALRPHGTLRDRVALDERLRRAAGESLRDYGRRPHGARERARLDLLAESGDGPVIGDNDRNLGAAVVAELSRLASGQGVASGQDGPHAAGP